MTHITIPVTLYRPPLEGIRQTEMVLEDTDGVLASHYAALVATGCRVTAAWALGESEYVLSIESLEHPGAGDYDAEVAASAAHCPATLATLLRRFHPHAYRAWVNSHHHGSAQ